MALFGPINDPIEAWMRHCETIMSQLLTIFETTRAGMRHLSDIDQI